MSSIDLAEARILTPLEALEAEAVYVMREPAAEFERPVARRVRAAIGA